MNKERYVDAVKAAEFLDISVRYLTDLARARRLPAHPLSLGAKRSVWRFRLSELEEFMTKAGVSSVEHPDRRTVQGGST